MTEKNELRVWATSDRWLIQRWVVGVKTGEGRWSTCSSHITLTELARELLERSAQQYVREGEAILDALKSARKHVLAAIRNPATDKPKRKRSRIRW